MNNTINDDQTSKIILNHFLTTNESKKNIGSRKLLKFNFFNHLIKTQSTQLTPQQQKLKDYAEQIQKDYQRHKKIKQQLAKQVFHLIISQPNLKQYQKSNPILQLKQNTSSRPPSTRFCLTSRTQKYNKSPFFRSNNKFASTSMNTYSKIDHNQKSRNKKQISTILKYLKSNPQNPEQQKQWCDLTNSDKYLMTYADFLQKKTRESIDYEVYKKKIRKKTNYMEIYQDYILQNPKISNYSKNKLSHCFMNIRNQWDKAESHVQKNKCYTIKRSLYKPTI